MKTLVDVLRVRAERDAERTALVWLEDGERLDVGLLLRRVGATRRERDRRVGSGLFRGLLHGRASTEDNHVGERHPLPA